jgi:hypothetical protein
MCHEKCDLQFLLRNYPNFVLNGQGGAPQSVVQRQGADTHLSAALAKRLLLAEWELGTYERVVRHLVPSPRGFVAGFERVQGTFAQMMGADHTRPGAEAELANEVLDQRTGHPDVLYFGWTLRTRGYAVLLCYAVARATGVGEVLWPI